MKLTKLTKLTKTLKQIATEILSTTLAAVLVFLPVLIPAPAMAAMYVPSEGTFTNEPINMIPSWYLRHLQADATRDGLLWSELTSDQQAQVVAELSRRINGTSSITGGASLAADLVAPAASTSTGTGGAIVMTSGAGGSTSGASGAVTIGSGTTTAGSGSATGNVIVQSGAGAASAAAVAGGASGTMTVRSQAGGANTGGASGQVGGAGGNLAVTGGAGGATNSTGAHAGGAGADVTVTSGAGGAASAGTGNGGAGGSIFLVPGDGGTSAGGTAGVSGVVQVGGTAPAPLFLNMVRSTISNGGTITDAQMRGGMLHQDASGGNVTMTTRTGAQMDTAFPDAVTGSSLVVRCSSNHATNTSTISGGANVTLVGSGALTQTGGTFVLIKTGSGTWDLVRVG